MVREGFEVVQQHWRILFAYVAVAVTIHLIHLGADEIFLSEDWIEANPSAFSAYVLGFEIFVTFSAAVSRSLFFARLGREIDKPFWKSNGDGDSIRRFLGLWFILNLITIGSLNLVSSIGQSEPDSALTLIVMWILFNGLLVPFGACVMFYGSAGREELVKAMDTLLRQFPRLATVLLLSYAVMCFVLAVMPAVPPWGVPLLVVVQAYVDCVVFSTTWLICMVHRDEEPEDEDFDF